MHNHIPWPCYSMNALSYREISSGDSTNGTESWHETEKKKSQQSLTRGLCWNLIGIFVLNEFFLLATCQSQPRFKALLNYCSDLGIANHELLCVISVRSVMTRPHNNPMAIVCWSKNVAWHLCNQIIVNLSLKCEGIAMLVVTAPLTHRK
jgi:hypothetical protein